MKNIILIIILILFSSNVFSQSEILKLNGKKIITDSLLVDKSENIFYTNKKGKTKIIKKTKVISVSQNGKTKIFHSEISKLNGKKIYTDTLLVDTSNYVFYTNKKGKTKVIEKAEVFSVEQNNKIQLFYVPDTISDSFSVAEMKDYLQGMHDGYNHKSYIFVSGGAIVGLAAPLTFPLIGMSNAITPIPSALYTMLIAIPKVKETKIDVPEEYKNNEHYVFGYQTAAKKKRIINTITSSLSGLVVGTVATIFVYSF